MFIGNILENWRKCLYEAIYKRSSVYEMYNEVPSLQNEMERTGERRSLE